MVNSGHQTPKGLLIANSGWFVKSHHILAPGGKGPSTGMVLALYDRYFTFLQSHRSILQIAWYVAIWPYLLEEIRYLHNNQIRSMTKRKTAVTSLLTHRSYCSLALSHRDNVETCYIPRCYRYFNANFSPCICSRFITMTSYWAL